MTKHFPHSIAILILVVTPMLAAAQSKKPTAAELSKKETVGSALLAEVANQEYEVRSAAEAMPAEKYGFRPAEGMFKGEHPEYGPAEMRTFGEIVKHVACSNFAFEAEMDGKTPPDRCDMGGPSPAKTRRELLVYLRDSFAGAREVNRRNRCEEHVRPDRRAVRGSNDTVTARRGCDLARGRPLWANDDLSAAERDRAARQQTQSARVERQIVRRLESGNADPTAPCERYRAP